MANTLCFTPVNSLTSPNKPGVLIGASNARKVVLLNNSPFGSVQTDNKSIIHSTVVKATENNNPGAKTNSLVCANCDGNDMRSMTTDNNYLMGNGFNTWKQPLHYAGLRLRTPDLIQSPHRWEHCAIACSQCQGTGVNSVDHFQGRFKAGALCWLCRGKKDMLCGDCNGAGFMGGFMTTFDE